MFQKCPRPRFVHVIGHSTLAALEHERLEDLTLMADPIEPSTIKAILLHGTAPSLRRLALGISNQQAAARGADEALLEGLAERRFPKLQELHIAYPEDGAAVLDAMAGLGLLEQLRVLSIEGNVFEDEERGLALLEKHRAALSKLSQLHLPIDDVMNRTDEELAKLIPPLRGTDELDDLKVFASARVLEAKERDELEIGAKESKPGLPTSLLKMWGELHTYEVRSISSVRRFSQQRP